MATVTNAAGASKSFTLRVPVIVGRRRMLFSKMDRTLHINDSPDPKMRFLLAEAQGVLGSPAA